jgi:hypothetical protein
MMRRLVLPLVLGLFAGRLLLFSPPPPAQHRGERGVASSLPLRRLRARYELLSAIFVGICTRLFSSLPIRRSVAYVTSGSSPPSWFVPNFTIC